MTTTVEHDTKTCGVRECPRSARSGGYCVAHYKRKRKYGVAEAGGPMRVADPIARLLANVRESNGCWVWTGQINNKGYGQMSFEGRKQPTHRIAYKLLRGPIPVGLELDHLCRVPLCFNPDHLEPVTHAENQRRMGEARTHCIRGHAFTPENTYRQPSTGRRRCRECARDRDRQPHRNSTLRRNRSKEKQS